jgi:hypothetical protein
VPGVIRLTYTKDFCQRLRRSKDERAKHEYKYYTNEERDCPEQNFRLRWRISPGAGRHRGYEVEGDHGQKHQPYRYNYRAILASNEASHDGDRSGDTGKAEREPHDQGCSVP